MLPAIESGPGGVAAEVCPLSRRRRAAKNGWLNRTSFAVKDH